MPPIPMKCWCVLDINLSKLYIGGANLLRMNPETRFKIQMIILVGFIVFLYILFALATSVYRDYQLERQIRQFKSQVDELAQVVNRRPEDVEYYQSEEYKDRYAKENLNLVNPGEKVIIIPPEEQVVRRIEAVFKTKTPDEVLDLPIYRQWWEYFFGQTLSVKAPSATPAPPPSDSDSDSEEVLDKPVL